MTNAKTPPLSAIPALSGTDLEPVLAALLEGSGDAVLLFAEAGRLLAASSRAFDLLGFARGEMERLRFGDLVETAAESVPPARDLSTPPRLPALRHREGRLLPLPVSIQRIARHDGEVVLCIGQGGAALIGGAPSPERPATPSSAPVQSEATARAHPPDLDTRHDTRHAGPPGERAIAQAQATVAGAIGHELRTPLTVLLGFLDMALGAWPAGADDRRYTQLTKARQAAVHMQHILEDMLLLARLDARVMPLEGAAVPLAPIAREAAISLRTAYPGQRVHVRGTAGMMVRADRGRLLQVLSNLLDNAAKYSPEGRAIRLEAETIGAEVVIRVIDQGLGIAAADLPRLFQRFTRLNETARAGRSSTGLGLSICRSLVEAMGGTISVDSALGVGSTFTVRLPSAVASAAELGGYDPLTHLPTRAMMQGMVAEEIERGHAQGQPLAVVSLKLIHFGQFDMAHGHRAADEAVRQVAIALRGALRAQDQLGRDGADAFLAFLPGADAHEAAGVVERLRLAVEGATFTVGSAALRLRLAAGTAIYPSDAADAREAIARAEAGRRHSGASAATMETAMDGSDLPAHFALAVSHELRTPLTTILGSAEVLLHSWERLDDAARRKGVERLLSGARRLDLLVRDLLLVVGLEKGSLLVSPVLTPLTPLLEQAIYDASAAHPNLDLRARGLRGAPMVWADPDRVVQVLMHLIDNAARHGHAAGPPELRVEVQPEMVKIRVTDRGPGLPVEGRTRLFTRFGKLNQNAHAGRIGTGLGLYVSRLLVEGMGGAIGVESTPGRGASFWFTLRRAATGGADEHA